ncbi:trimeric intracellular cation channel family protein [Flavicella marina]|uniref:trimeric intracellular cation channel family protein n=1 Tax=Flavicella marina TaxID=1475951 RepID=UPI0012655C44|nr:trimeric intracellular cation channel family protein [Flavicella marina]
MDIIIGHINVMGSFVFAISGALVAIREKLDPFGVLIVAFITAVGGGTIRDMLLAERDVFWLFDTTIIYAILAGAIIAMIFKEKLQFFDKPIFFYDAIGLGLFTITGVQIGIDYKLTPLICILLGTVTGVFGGVLRDIIVNEIPVVFQKEIYATASILGGILYLVLVEWNVSNPFLQIIPISSIIITRIVAVKFNISLPTIYKKEQ